MSKNGWMCAAAALGVIPLTLGACAVDAVDSSEAAQPERASSTIEPIIDGVESTAYPEAALLDTRTASGASFACSAVLIAPRVVLTAGHCVDGMASFTVHVGGVDATSSSGETFDWHENGATMVNPNHHDVGLVYLDERVQISKFPTIAASPVPSSTQLIDLGRIEDGVLTNAFYKAPVNVFYGSAIGYPNDYYGGDVIEHGDSGGPVFVPGTHTIVGVNSGANSSLEVVARTDLLQSWIAQRVAAAQSKPILPPMPLATGQPGMLASAGSAVETTPAIKPPVAGSCPSEKEVNDTFASANPMSGSIVCGSLATPTDTDWFAYSATAGTTQLRLSASADASFALGYVNSAATCSIVIPAGAGASGATLTVAKGGAPLQVCVSVSSRKHTVQTYTLTASHSS